MTFAPLSRIMTLRPSADVVEITADSSYYHGSFLSPEDHALVLARAKTLRALITGDVGHPNWFSLAFGKIDCVNRYRQHPSVDQIECFVKIWYTDKGQPANRQPLTVTALGVKDGMFSSEEVAILLTCEVDGESLTVAGDWDDMARVFEISLNDDLDFLVNGTLIPYSNQWFETLRQNISYYRTYDRRRYDAEPLTATIEGVAKLRRCVAVDAASTNALLRYHLRNPLSSQTQDVLAKNPAGVAKTWAKLAPLVDSIQMDHPLDYCLMKSAALASGRTIDSVKVSKVINDAFAAVETVDQLLTITKPASEALMQMDSYLISIDGFIKGIGAFQDNRKEALKRNNNSAFKKLMQDAEFLEIDAERHPNLYKAVLEDAAIPVTTFFRKSEQYFLSNDNYDLWEEMLAHHYDVTVELAVEVAKRTTYEKDLMSYFFFVLYGLPEYLEKHTGRKWTCSPRFVESQSELDPPTEKEGSLGITRKRSALTPVADNETNHVVVPYASFHVSGRQTTYCYSHSYHALTRGMSFNGNAVVNDLEVKLNGRDDYGLMFYTLTGSFTNRGYPTFLIIFERRDSGTFVHFHRTHPSRSKQGDYNPIHNWIKVCYNWMIGNVPRSKIVAQQGDLAFVKIDPGTRRFEEQVTSYDNHQFDRPVLFNDEVPAKQNILGYLRLDAPAKLLHHEHMTIDVPPGTYELRQCKSWEASPRGVWSLRID